MWLWILLIAFVMMAIVGLSIYLVLFASESVAVKPAPATAAPVPTIPYPCIMKDSFGKTIYGALMDAGQLVAGASLLEVLDLFLCTLQNCSTATFAANKTKLMSLGGTADDADAQKRTQSFATFDTPTPPSAFLVMTTSLITKHLAQLKETKALPRDEIQQLNGYVYQMCAHYYPEFLRTCKNAGLP